MERWSAPEMHPSAALVSQTSPGKLFNLHLSSFIPANRAVRGQNGSMRDQRLLNIAWSFDVCWSLSGS